MLADDPNYHGDRLRRRFEHEMRKDLPAAARELLDAASEIHVRYAKKAERGEATKLYAPAFERLRSALLSLKEEGYVGEEWQA